MSLASYFADDYSQARQLFLDAAQKAHVAIQSHILPDQLGPQGEKLCLDAGWMGPTFPRQALVLVAGTHGVEGFVGSACQIAFLQNQMVDALPPDTSVLLIHALNPFGFAYLRRTNEDNIDLNRNFQDFSTTLPSSKKYEEIHPSLVPNQWEGPEREEADAKIQQYFSTDEKKREFQATVTAGQYTRPDGLFYGGTEPAWSNTTIRNILHEKFNSNLRQCIVLDFHTGLGPPAYGEPILMTRDIKTEQQAITNFGPEVTSMRQDNSVSAQVVGSLEHAFFDLPAEAQITYLTLEFGTQPILHVLNALRADNWLHQSDNLNSPWHDQIKRQIRDAFNVDTPAWKAAVVGRATDFLYRAARAFSSS